MNTLVLILKEIVHRKINFLLGIVGVVMTVGFLVAFLTTGKASQNETTRIMRDMGYNLRIIPKETDMDRFYSQGYADLTMPADIVNRFATQRGITYVHLLATLQEMIEWRGSSVLLTGIATEIDTADKKKSAMIFEVDPGTAYVGYEIGREHNLKSGDVLDIAGRELKVEKVLAEQGSVDDIRIYGLLEDVQQILGKPGQINEIKALDCLCRDPNRQTIEILREELEGIVPEGKVVKIEAIAMARERQRIMLEDYFALVMPLLMLVCALWIGTLAMINTRERRNEIGILRALGYGSGEIAGLFLGKAILIGLVGAVIGYGLGTWFALAYGPEVFKVTAKSIQPETSLLYLSLIAAPLFAALSSFIPAMVAVTDDPAVTLREE